MNSPKTLFLQALRLPPDLTDEARTRSIVDLVSLAAGDRSQPISLRNIHEAVSRYECVEYLEPLDVLPTLLPCRLDGAMDLIRTCALYNSPKEVMIVIQESIVHLRARLNSEEDQEEENDIELAQRAIGIVSLCSPAISRSRLGRVSAPQLCSPVLEKLAPLISSVAPLATKEEGRTLIIEVARLVKSLAIWASSVTDAAGLLEIQRLLRELLDVTVIGYAPSIQACLAARAAEGYFPRFFVKSSTRDGWQDGGRAMLEVQLALESLGDSSQGTRWKFNSFSDLVYLAHSTPPAVLSPSTQSDLHHLLVRALQMNAVVDEALFLIFRILTHESMNILPEFATSLCTILTALASTHLDASMRQLNLRLLSLTLTKLPPHPRIEVLLKLTTHEDFPQIRGPAVGLVKEAVLEALALPPDHASRNPFASPELLRLFGGVLFRPNPPELFNEMKTREELAQSLEMLRIADCLSFYYVLLQRDHDNKTGIRSKGNVTSVRSSMLRPLRQFLDEHVAREERPLMVISSLQVGLDRIDSALRSLDAE